MRINIQDFCNSYGLITEATASTGMKLTASREGVSPIPEFDPSALFYNTGKFTAVSTSNVKSLIKQWLKDQKPEVKGSKEEIELLVSINFNFSDIDVQIGENSYKWLEKYGYEWEFDFKNDRYESVLDLLNDASDYEIIKLNTLELLEEHENSDWNSYKIKVAVTIINPE
jgi:hypothetical protein